MIKKLFTISLILLLFSCKLPEKEVSNLSKREQEKLNQLLDERRKCFIDNINMLDRGQEDVKSVVDLVTWRCGIYENTINSLLYKEYGVRLGAAYGYTEKLRNDGPKEITEALLAKRKMDAARTPLQENLLRKNN